MSTQDIPEGFVSAPIGGDFTSYNGPIYARWHDQHLQLGFRVNERQINPGNACHGGMLSLFADILLSSAAQYQTDIPRQFLPTISLQLDFMASAPFGPVGTGSGRHSQGHQEPGFFAGAHHLQWRGGGAVQWRVPTRPLAAGQCC